MNGHEIINKKKDLVLAGFGGHGRSVADSIEEAGIYRIAGYTAPEAEADGDYPYLGTDDTFRELYGRGIRNCAIGVGYLGGGSVRDRIYGVLKEQGYELPVIADPEAAVSKRSEAGEGTWIGKKAVVNARASVGKVCIVNTGAVLEHDVFVGDFSHVAVGAVVCGGVRIGSHAFIGANATLVQGISVGEHAVIGAGSVVLADVPDGARVHGVWKGI